VFNEAKDDGGGGDNWSYESIWERPDALPVTQQTAFPALKRFKFNGRLNFI